MKKFLYIIMFVLMNFIFNSVNSQASCGPVSGCNWSQEQTANVTIGNCSFTVKYQYAVCSGVACYFKINSLNDIGTECMSYEVSDLMHEASKVILGKPWLTCPEVEGCIKVITEYSSACWKWDGVIGPSNPTVSLISCDVNSCCEKVWNYCNGVASLISTNIGEPCPTPLPEDCFVVCE